MILVTQVELRSDRHMLVGFIEADLASRGEVLKVNDRAWTVTQVFVTEEKLRKLQDGSIVGRVAWWFKAQRMTN